MRCLIRSLSRRIECFKGCSASSVVAAVAEHRGLKTRAALGSGGGGGYGKLESGKRERREKEKLASHPSPDKHRKLTVNE